MLADALTSVLGIVGAVLVARWSIGLLRASGAVLLDTRGPRGLKERIVSSIEADGDSRVADLHLWSIGRGVYAAEVHGALAGPEHLLTGRRMSHARAAPGLCYPRPL